MRDNTEKRLVYRAIVRDRMNNIHDLRVLANEHGLLRIFLTGISRSLSYAGINENALPASVAQSGGSNKNIAAKVKRAMSIKPTEEWIEPEPVKRKIA